MTLSFIAAPVVRDAFLRGCPFRLNYINFATASLSDTVSPDVILHDISTLRLAMLASIANASEEELRGSLTYLANLGIDNITDAATIIYVEMLIMVNRESLRIGGKAAEAAKVNNLSFLESLSGLRKGEDVTILPSFDITHLPVTFSGGKWCEFMQAQYNVNVSGTLSEGLQSSTRPLSKTEFTDKLDPLLQMWWVAANEWADDSASVYVQNTLSTIKWDVVTQLSFRHFLDGIDFSEPTEYSEFAIWMLNGMGFKEVDWMYRANCIIKSGLLLAK